MKLSLGQFGQCLNNGGIVMRRNSLTKLGKAMVAIIFLLVIIIALLVLPGPSFSEELATPDGTMGGGVMAPADNTQALERHIRWFHRGVRAKKRMNNAIKLIPVIIKSAGDTIDPLFIAVTIGCESSWETGAVGAIGEQGLMQVHGQAATGYDLTRSDEQIRAGTNHLKAHWKRCGTAKGAVTGYLTGQCERKLRIVMRQGEDTADYRLRLWKESRSRLDLPALDSPFF